MAELELRELRKTYRARGRPTVDAVRGLDLALRSGELLGLLGPSGCGKSTPLRMIAGLETVTGGDVLVDGSSKGVERHVVALTGPEVRLAHDEHVRITAGLTHVLDAETGGSLR